MIRKAPLLGCCFLIFCLDIPYLRTYISPMRPSISRSSKSISSKVNRSADNRTAPYISILYKWLFRLDRVKITIFTLDPSFVPRPSIPAENQGELLQLIPESVV